MAYNDDHIAPFSSESDEDDGLGLPEDGGDTTGEETKTPETAEEEEEDDNFGEEY